ncbi:MAG: hypothetical protein J6S67_04880 [Methanobrevibacter sp.]|nr:hypothetical protein [Methanobrevibacter sp.]
MGNILCETCVHFVSCGIRDRRIYGYCLFEDLYTYTSRKRCEDYTEGVPLKEEELETIV